MNEIFKPKSKEQIIWDVARSSYKNRKFLIDFYEKYPEKFDALFNELCQIPNVFVESAIKNIQTSNRCGPFQTAKEACALIKIFKILEFRGSFKVFCDLKTSFSGFIIEEFFVGWHN